MTTNNTCKINDWHCENCGSTAPELVSDTVCRDGYSQCCNENVTDARFCRGHHNH